MKKIIILILFILFCALNCTFATETKEEKITYTLKQINQIIKNQEIDKLDEALENGFNPNSAYANMPMTYLSLYYKNGSAFVLFLSYGADIYKTVPPMFVSKYKENLLTYAIYQKDAEAVNNLMIRGFDPNKTADKYSPLNYAIIKKQPEIIAILLQYGAKTDSITYELLNKRKYESLKPLFVSYND